MLREPGVGARRAVPDAALVSWKPVVRPYGPVQIQCASIDLADDGFAVAKLGRCIQGCPRRRAATR